ncbi:MAG: phenylalanine--tRNA ligase subunit beta [Candidatus Omnitrophica bacterium]|jgi:phenylalanyl-tRNA synthetase beta chain|nr:phenylalanine--tRNA ligase subunit beta [Candidatus Omnitrophota bacterium]
MRFSLNFVKELIKIDLPAEKVAQLLTMAGIEVEHFERQGEDYVFDIEITSNRYDWLSIVGIAREIAACLGKKLDIKYPKVIKSPLIKDKLIKIENSTDCPFYIARRIRGVTISASPGQLKERVINCRINSINNAVDITNYCMLKWGNPLHAFDEDKIEGNIYIRRAKEGEKFIGIDEKERILNRENLVIADDSKVIALAGVMGAKNTEVTEKTKNVLLEAAIFSPLWIRHSRRAAGIDTDSSYRFERQVFADYLEHASAEAAGLIVDICGGKIAAYGQAGRRPQSKDKKVLLELDKLNEYLGVQYPKSKVKSILVNLGFKVKEPGKNKLALLAPKHRSDITEDVDVYEEISRIYGYDKIKQQIPAIAHEVVKNEIYEFKKELRQFLCALELNEIITYSIESDEELNKLGYGNLIKLVNPLRAQENSLRPGLSLGMIKAISYNLNRNRSNLRFFEIANVYSRGQGSFCELPRLSIGICEEGKDLFYLKGIIEEVFKFLNINDFEFKEKSLFFCVNALEVFVNKKSAGFLGKLDEKFESELELKKDLYLSEFDITILQAARKLKCYSAMSPYPAVFRDISIAMRASKHFSDVEKTIKEKKEYISDYRIIDTYKGKDLEQGFCAFSLRIFYQSNQRTLTSQEVDEIHNAIRTNLSVQEGIKLR